LKNDRDDILVLISIIVDIMFKNPRTYPIGAAILSKFLSLTNSSNEQIKILNAVISKFRMLPNIGYLEIWIQRIVLKAGHEISFEEPICRKLNDANVSLWNSDWLNNNRLKQIITNSLTNFCSESWAQDYVRIKILTKFNNEENFVKIQKAGDSIVHSLKNGGKVFGEVILNSPSTKPSGKPSSDQPVIINKKDGGSVISEPIKKSGTVIAPTQSKSGF
jgi:hypothetical protein